MLKRIRIKNYKNLRDTGDIELGPINLLVGPNASGKTALWEILWRIKRLFGNEDFREIWRDYEDVVSDRDQKRPISFEFSTDLEGDNLVYSLTMSRLRLKEEKMVLNDEAVFHADVEYGD